MIRKKADMIAFVKEHLSIFKVHELYATGTTGSMLIKYTGLSIHLKNLVH